MAAKTHPFRRIRLVYRRSSLLSKCALLAALVLCTACLLTLRFQLTAEQAKQEQLRAEAVTLEQRNAELAEMIAQLGTVQSVKRIALTELNLVTPDTVLFIPAEPKPE